MISCYTTFIGPLLVIILLIVKGNVCSEFSYPLPKRNDEVQADAARAVAQRLLDSKASFFNINVNQSTALDKRDTFQIIKDRVTGSVNITGSSGVAACWGLHHYLKHYCHCHISWDGDQLNLPGTLPGVNETVTSVDIFRYYQNVVTTSYSFVWWNWNRWQREIDWMALNGINIALAFTGQEAIWERVYYKLNLTTEEIEEHFCGPAFLAWCRMGNIRGWGGPLTLNWHRQMLVLQHQILRRMRELGIIPILPAFAGHVPKAFDRLFPNANMTRMNPWVNFVNRYCCPYLLEPTEPLFHQVGTMFLKELVSEFGTGHFYNCDTFNEMSPPKGDLPYLRNISAAIFRAMNDVDQSAIWVLQGWMFYSEESFWISNRVEAFVTRIPIGRMIILDLQSELHPQYIRLDSYFGQPFIWCMLHNFGGTLGLYGAVGNVNKGIFEARSMNGSTMVGIGLTPEGINQNYVVYDLVLDLTWRREPVNLTSWFLSYALRRYGLPSHSVDRAWLLLMTGVYNFSGPAWEGQCVITQRPSLDLKTEYWYNTTELKMAWDGFIEAIPLLGNSALFQHDLVDVSRQVMQVLGDGYYARIIKSYHSKNISSLQQNADRFQDLLWNMNEILATNKNFLLGSWLNDAKNLASSRIEREIFEFNARNQITLWGPLGEIKDYATKQWSGIVSTYYLPRWRLFLDYLSLSLQANVSFDQTLFIADVFENVEEIFTLDTTVFPSVPRGSCVETAQLLYSRWRNNSIWKELLNFEKDNINESDPKLFPDKSEPIPEVIQI